MEPTPPPSRRTRDLRASDADRERTVTLFREAAADGRLTLEEHAERVEGAYASRTLGDLADLTTDLTEDPAAAPVHTDTDRVVAVFGSEQRRGRWVVPSRLPTIAVLGAVKLDLREALLERREVTITANAILGDVQLIVPEGVEVRMTGPAILGEKSTKVRRPATSGGPVVHVRCFILLGEVQAKSPPRQRRWFGG